MPRIDRLPPSCEGDRADYPLEAAAKYPAQFAVMAASGCSNRKRATHARDLEGPGTLGVRLTFHHPWDEAWITDGTADWFWPHAERLEIPVMMNVPTVLPAVAPSLAGNA
jgi:hypothetical protein